MRRAASRDYRPLEHLDRYEREGIDDQFLDDVTEEERFAARLAAERELAERDAVEGRLTGRRRGLPAALEGAHAAGLCATKAWAAAWPRCTPGEAARLSCVTVLGALPRLIQPCRGAG